MGRQPVASERLPAQRPTSEFRELQATCTTQQTRIGELEEQLAAVMQLRNHFEQRAKKAEATLAEVKKTLSPVLEGKQSLIGKLKIQVPRSFQLDLKIEYLITRQI